MYHNFMFTIVQIEIMINKISYACEMQFIKLTTVRGARATEDKLVNSLSLTLFNEDKQFDIFIGPIVNVWMKL